MAGQGALNMLLRLRSIPGADWNFTRAKSRYPDILARDKGMATLDHQIDDVRAMSRGKKD